MKDNYIIIEGKKYRVVPWIEELETKKVNSGFVKEQIVENTCTQDWALVGKSTLSYSKHLSWQDIARLCAPLNADKAILSKDCSYIYYLNAIGNTCKNRNTDIFRVPYRNTVDPEGPNEIDIEWIMKDE